jgi:hypothetical protein
MIFRFHSECVPYIEHKTKRVFRVRADKCFTEAYPIPEGALSEEQIKNIREIPVKLCVVNRFDHPHIINEFCDELLPQYKKDSEELYGVMKYFDSVEPYIGVTFIVNQRGLNMCGTAVHMINIGKGSGFILHSATMPDLKEESRNDEFNYNDFFSGKHYFLEQITYQVLKTKKA